jgi:hypothetical protein
MKDPKDPSSLTDIEKLHPTVAEFVGDESGGERLSVRLGDLWTEFVRPAKKGNDREAGDKPGSSVPLLDDMKGILQWD